MNFTQVISFVFIVIEHKVRGKAWICNIYLIPDLIWSILLFHVSFFMMQDSCKVVWFLAVSSNMSNERGCHKCFKRAPYFIDSETTDLYHIWNCGRITFGTFLMFFLSANFVKLKVGYLHGYSLDNVSIDICSSTIQFGVWKIDLFMIRG